MLKIDHLMFAVPDLADGLLWAHNTFGVEPVYGGEHVGLGTCNALLSLGDIYLEIIAPDKQQQLSGNFGAQLAALETPGLVTWAVAGDLNRVARLLADMEVDTLGPQPTERKTSSGELLQWALLFPHTQAYQPQLPFFIDWMQCEHPSRTSPVAGSFKQLKIYTNEVARQQRLLHALALPIGIELGPAALAVDVQTANDLVTLTSTVDTLALRLFG